MPPDISLRLGPSRCRSTMFPLPPPLSSPSVPSAIPCYPLLLPSIPSSLPSIPFYPLRSTALPPPPHQAVLRFYLNACD